MSVLVKTNADVQKLGTILSVWAHPDDETYSCGALMAAAVANGQRVICVTATRGEAGVQDATRWPPDKLNEIREQELKAALLELGITEHHWLDYQDGECSKVPQDEAAQRIGVFIAQCQPDTILTFGPDGMTGHPDHQAVSAWVDKAVRHVNKVPQIYHAMQVRDIYEKYLRGADEEHNIFFNIDEPPLRDCADCVICFVASQAGVKQKYRALKAMPSQTTGMLETFPLETFQAVFATEAFVKA